MKKTERLAKVALALLKKVIEADGIVTRWDTHLGSGCINQECIIVDDVVSVAVLNNGKFEAYWYADDSTDHYERSNVDDLVKKVVDAAVKKSV